ncbi:MAG: thiamine-phosphate kinase [Truepera sp.]|nr:thiamine-phosphate kinase [Truepera sp.]MBS3967800.1 thiamine-phosphate kinase [Truepera sp.]
MRVSDIGEFALIDRLAKIVSSEHPSVLVGIGDDTAVLEGGGEMLLLATVDAQVETVHFLREAITPQQLGRRALAVNLSDIAAMGGRGSVALVSLVLPRETEVAWLEHLYQGLREEAERWGVVVVGGNMARAPEHAVIDVCVLGWISRDELLLRAGARPGDLVLVTGTLGEAAAGLRLLQRADQAPASTVLLARLLTPTPRLPEAAVIAKSKRATAMIDLSDGLSSDLLHICQESRVGVRLWAERLPVTAAVQEVAHQCGETALDLALGGGEDFELCFTAPADTAETLARTVYDETGTPVTIIGEVLPQAAGHTLVLPGGEETVLKAKGWEHFKRNL